MDQTRPPETPVIFCQDCGNPLAPGAMFCGNCGCPVSKPKAFPIFNIVKIAVAAVLLIVAIIMVVKGNNVLKSDDMKFYKEHLQTCEEGRADCQRSMYQASSQFYYLYKDLVESYDEMIDNDKEEIAALKSKANTSFSIAGVCAAAAAVVVVVPWKKVLKVGAD